MCIWTVKIKWDKLLVQFGKSQIGVGSFHLTREQFSEPFGIALKEAVTPKNVVSEFKLTGLFPINANEFTEDIFNPVGLQRYKNGKKQKMTVSSSLTSLFSSASSELANDKCLPGTSRNSNINKVDHNKISYNSLKKTFIRTNDLYTSSEFNGMALDNGIN